MTLAEAVIRHNCIRALRQFNALSYNQGRPDITFTNQLDGTSLPIDCRLIAEPLLQSHREFGKVEKCPISAGCDCISPDGFGACSDEGCSCLEDMYLGDEPGRTVPYQWSSGNIKTLKTQLLRTKNAVYECNDECACTSSCMTRLVQFGRTIPLDIFRTDDGRGFGTLSDHRCITANPLTLS